MSIIFESQENFWIDKIERLRVHKGVDVENLTENDGSTDGDVWKDKLRAKEDWNSVERYAIEICVDIFNKQTQNISDFPVDAEGYILWRVLLNDLDTISPDTIGYDALEEANKLSNIFYRKIGVNVYDDTFVTNKDGDLVVDEDGNHITVWEDTINKLIPDEVTLDDIPEGNNLVDLLYEFQLFAEISRSNGLPNLIEEGHDVAEAYGVNWNYRINTNKLAEYKNFENNINEVKGILNLDPTDVLPNDWSAQLVKKTDLDTARATIATLTVERDSYRTKATEYDRIYTKLGGKVSNAELDTLLNAPPPPPQCSHTDYDTLKSANQNLTNGKNKIIQELGLATNSNLGQILTKIKELMKSPADKDAKIVDLEQQLKDKEEIIAKLQARKPSEKIKSEVIKNIKELGSFNQNLEQKLRKADSYRELIQVQKIAFSKKLSEEKKSLSKVENDNKQLKVGLALAILLLIIFSTIIYQVKHFFNSRRPPRLKK